MNVDQGTLVTAFPEFGNADLFPAGQVAFWLDLANATLSADLFGVQRPLAVCLYAAHHLALSAQGAASANAGGASFGAVSGAVTSKSVGSVSKSMDVRLTAFEGAGPWNATTYGQRYYQLIRAFATGPFYRTKLASTPKAPHYVPPPV